MPHEVTVTKVELLGVLEKNREGHREKFLKAQKAYRQRAIEELDRSLEDARMGRDIRLIISLPKPEDHTEDYDREIRMLKMSVSDQITLQSYEFDQFVMDRWDWSQKFTTTASSYGVQ